MIVACKGILCDRRWRRNRCSIGGALVTGESSLIRHRYNPAVGRKGVKDGHYYSQYWSEGRNHLRAPEGRPEEVTWEREFRPM